MKKLATLLMVLVLPMLAMAQPAEAPADGPAITFEEKEFDFGDITQGDVVEHTFVLTNTGNAPLILTNVLVTCGCTATEWPRQPIMPGTEAEIEVSFNSEGKMGLQNKHITIMSNSPQGQVRVTLMGNVLPNEG